MRALFVTQFYRPELIGSAPFCADVAEWLEQSGYAVTVLTGLPHYPDAAIFPAYRDGSHRRENINNIDVKRVGIWVPKRRSAAARIASEILFLANGCRALLSGHVRRHRLVFSLCPSILAVLLGQLAKRRGGRHVAIVHDIQSGLAEGLDMVSASWLVRLMQKCERHALNRVDLVVVLTAEMREHLRRLGVSTEIEVMPIWTDTDRIRPATELPPPQRVIYSGSFGRKQKLEQVIDLAKDLQARRPEIEVLLRGRGAEFEALRRRIEAEALPNVHFENLVPIANLADAFAAADIHLVVQNPVAAAFAIPSKIYNIMAAGLPCVAPARDNSALGRLQKKSKGFLRPPPGDVGALASAVLRLVDDETLRRRLGKAARQYVEQNCRKQTVLQDIRAAAEQLFHAGRDKGRHGLLIFEPDSEGHPFEWCRHLIRFAQADGPRRVLWMVVGPELYEKLAPLIRDLPDDLIRLLALRRREAQLCRHRWLLIGSLARWWIARRYLRETGAAAIHFLSLDLVALPLALGSRLGGKVVSGILFRPSVHYRFLGPYDPTLRERLRDLRKQIVYRFMLFNPALTSVLTIDPYFARYAQHSYARGFKVHPLPDPAQEASEPAVQPPVSAFPSDQGRQLFLLFGHLSERKGTLTLLDAIELLPPHIARAATFVMAGRVDPSIAGEVRRRCKTLRIRRRELSIHLEDRWLSTEEIEILVRQSDIVLAPYQRFVGSSGVMLWAAQFGKPILTQDFGVLGPLVREYRLGIAADCSHPLPLAEAIARFVRHGTERFIDRDSAQEFAMEHSPRYFARSVLEGVDAA